MSARSRFGGMFSYYVQYQLKLGLHYFVCSDVSETFCKGSRSSNILVLTDHPEPQLIILALSRSNESYSLISKGQISLYDRHASQAEFCTDIALHPSGHLAVVSCYKGKLTVVSFKKGSFDDHFDVTYAASMGIYCPCIDSGFQCPGTQFICHDFP